jgi:hypothetical protein
MENSGLVVVIIQSALFAGGLFKIWLDSQIKMREMEIRLGNLESRVEDDIKETLNKIIDKLNSMEVKMENKVNRQL